MEMIVAVIGYALTTVIAWSLEAHDANGKLLPQSKLTLERLVVWLSQIVFIFLSVIIWECGETYRL